MHPAIKNGPIAIYARYSSSLQNERSIEDQVRRCREYIAQQGGSPDAALVFPDFAVSGASLDRPGFETMMAAIKAKKVKAIVTEDMSRISRDFADSANIFKQLQFLGVPLLGVADGIDTSTKHAKLSFVVKSLVSDMYLDDLRDKTLRGLEGRALQGFATGNVAYGFHTVPVKDAHGTVMGNKIDIHDAEAKVVRRIFRAAREGISLGNIARELNRDGIPSPRVGQRHKCFGWGQSTIRAMLRNERYIGLWRFKQTQWMKVPGTNKRRPRPRNAAEVMVSTREDLRIIDQRLWNAVHERLEAIAQRYKHGKREPGIVRRRTDYLMSGLLFCARCGGPMSISAGSSAAYYRCQTNRTKGVCDNTASVREDRVRETVLAAIQQHMTTGEGLAKMRKRVAQEAAEHGRKIDAQIKTRRGQLAKTKEKLSGLVSYLATGDRSPTVVATLHELEAHAMKEEAELAVYVAEADKPIQLPSLDELTKVVADLNLALMKDPEIGRATLRRWLVDGRIELDRTPEGVVASTKFVPERIVIEGDPRKREIPQVGSDLRDNPLFSLGSGGALSGLIYRISKVKSRSRTLQPGSCR
jgi:DNA invertase Pin-like site-specific DNA recombinase